MSSQVDIANQALSKLGALPIVAFTDDTTEANVVATNYDPAKRFLLRCFPWRCAIKSEPLALLDVDEANEYWPYTFAWPEKCLRIEGVVENTYPYSKAAKWESRGKTVLARVNNIVAEYTAEIEEPDFDAHVEQVMVDLLATKIAYAITGSNSREQNLNAIYDRTLLEAKTVDRQEASHRTFQIDTLVRDR